jgi:hypothetical protein
MDLARGSAADLLDEAKMQQVINGLEVVRAFRIQLPCPRRLIERYGLAPGMSV